MKNLLLIIIFSVVFIVGCSPVNPVDVTETSDQLVETEMPVVNEDVPETEVTTENTDTQEAAGVEINKDMTMNKFVFDPAVLEVSEGDVIHLTLTAVDAAHGFKIVEYGINATLEKGESETITIVADKKGTFKFSCSVPCGSGHSAMEGQLIVN